MPSHITTFSFRLPNHKERSVPAGGRVFVEDLGVRAAAGSPLFCGVVTSDSTASWNVTTLGGRA